MTTIVYVVQGFRGSYDSYEEWIERAFFDKKMAEIHCKELNKKHRKASFEINEIEVV